MICKACNRPLFYGADGSTGDSAAWECTATQDLFCGACCVPVEAPHARTQEELRQILSNPLCPECGKPVQLASRSERQGHEALQKPNPLGGALGGAFVLGFIGAIVGNAAFGSLLGGLVGGGPLGLVVGAWIGAKDDRPKT